MKARIAQNEIDNSIFAGLIKTDGILYKSGIDHKLLELIKLRVAQINSCAYCLDMHYKEAEHLGETPQRLYSLSAWRETPYYSELEQAVLAYTEAITNVNRAHFEPELMAALEKYFNKDQIALITLAISQINTWTRLNIAFGTVPGGYVVGQYA